MNIKPKKSAYFLSLGILLIGFIVVIVLTTNQLSDINLNSKEIKETPISVEIGKDDAYYVYLDIDLDITSVDLLGNNVIVVTNDRTFSMTVAPTSEDYEYTIYEIDETEAIATDLYKPAFAIYVDNTQVFELSTTSGEGLLLSPLTNYDIIDFGKTLRLIMGVALVASIAVFAIIYSKRSKSKKEIALSPDSETWMDDVETSTENPFAEATKKEDSFNDF